VAEAKNAAKAKINQRSELWSVNQFTLSPNCEGVSLAKIIFRLLKNKHTSRLGIGGCW
jgi:hypothetical protein